jgi:DNA-binding response OmpR family regulator
MALEGISRSEDAAQRNSGANSTVREVVTSVVIIEDDAGIRVSLARWLTERGYDVRPAVSGRDGLAVIMDTKPDAVLLDLGLPDIDGRDLLRMLRAVSTVPVIVVTARDDEAEIVGTLDAGADDYVVKPFSAGQLEARLRAVLRRFGNEQPSEAPVRVGGLQVDPATRLASLEGRELDLSRKEFDLLFFLASRAGRVVTKRQLLAEVWDQPYGGAEKTVDVHLSWLRRKLGETATAPRYLRTVHGVGVRLVDPGHDPARARSEAAGPIGQE